MSAFQRFLMTARQTKVTSLLVIINTVYFILSRLLDSRSFRSLSQDSFLLNWGADLPGLTFAGEYWRLFTSLFLHVGVSHLVMNMVALWAVGTVLEKRIPRPAFIGIYFLSGLAGNLLSNIVNIDQTIISCGASGAVLGLIAALLAYFMVTRTNSESISINSLLLSLVLTAGLGLFPFIDNMAHLGGAATGFVLGFLVSICVTVLTYPGKFAYIVLSIIFILPVVGLYIGYMQYRTPNGQVQLDSSHLIQILRSQGAGDSAYRNSNISRIDSCIYNNLKQKTTDMDTLQRCKWYSYNNELYTQLDSCLVLTTKLRDHYPAISDQQRLDTVERYCTSRKQLYGLVVGIQSDITTEKIDEARQAMYLLSDEVRLLGYYNRRGYYDYEPQDSVQTGVLTDIDPVLFELVSKTECPSHSCSRF